MSKNLLNEENESGEIELNKDTPQKLRKKKNEDESSEISSDSSTTASYKQSKIPNTLLKSHSSVSKTVSHPTTPTAAESDLAEHLQRRLQEAEQSLSSRDVLISMLREQLTKTENLYKQTVDDSLDLRHKHCLMAQDLNNLTIICKKYKEDASLIEGDKGDQELVTLQNEVENWKTQYNDLLAKTQVIDEEETDMETVKKISAEIQVDLKHNISLKNELDILKDQYVRVKNILEEQNKKMDFVVEQLKQQPNTNNNLDTIKEKIDPPREVIGISIEHNIKCAPFDEEKHNPSGMLNNEVEHLKLQIEHLNNINTELQSEFREVDKFKEEVKRLSLLANEEQKLPNPLMLPSLPLEAKDSLVKLLKEEHHHLKEELEVKIHSLGLEFFDSTDDSVSLNESIDGSSAACNQDRNSRVSRESFTATNRDVILHSQGKIKQFLEPETERLHTEIERLRNQLEKQDETIQELKQVAETIMRTKNVAIKDFENANQSLNKDYHELSKINTTLSENVKKVGMYEKISSNQAPPETTSTSRNTEEIKLNNNVELYAARDEMNKNRAGVITKVLVETVNEEKFSLCGPGACKMRLEENRKLKDDLEGKSKQLEVMSKDGMEKDKIIKGNITEIQELKKIINETANKLESKLKELTELKVKAEDLQTTINMLKVKVDKASEEHEQHNKIREDNKGCKCKIQELETTILERENSIATYKKENEILKLQITRMKNNSQQFREEADFKKLENEKLREKEDRLQKTVTSVRRNSESITREFEREVVKNKELLQKYNEIEKDLQTKMEEIAKLKKSLEQKDEHAKTLTDKINGLTQTKSCHEQTLCQMKYDFNSREAELLATIKELKTHETNPLIEEENSRLKKRLQAYIDERDTLEYGIKLQHGMDLKTLQDDYNNEKAKNEELNGVLNNIRKEVDYLRIHVDEILLNLELRLTALKNNVLENKCSSISQQSIEEMLRSIQEFKSNTLEQENTCKLCSEETYSCYYDDPTSTCSENCQRKTDTLESDGEPPESTSSSTSYPSWATQSEILELKESELYNSTPIEANCMMNPQICGNTQTCKISSTEFVEIMILREPIETTLKAADSNEDLELDSREELQKPRLKDIEEVPEFENESIESTDTNVPTTGLKEIANQQAVLDDDKIERKELSEHTPSCFSTNSAGRKVVHYSAVQSISAIISHDTVVKNSNDSLLNIIYQSSDDDDASMISSMLSTHIIEQPNKKHAPTAIPVPIHSSHQRKSKENCPNTQTKINDRDSKQKAPSSCSDQNVFVLPSPAESTAVPRSSCGCLKVSHIISSQSQSSNNAKNLKKSCICLKNDNPSSETSKDCKQCKCKNNGENSKQ